MTDTETLELLRQICRGSDIAFEKLAEKYKAVTHSAAHRAASSMEKSGLVTGAGVLEDLKQDARLALYKAALKYDADGVGHEVTFGLYAKICVRNAMISEIRRAAARRRRVIRVAAAEERLRDKNAGDVTSEGAISKIELEQIIKKSGSALSKYEQRVLMLYMQGKSTAEISEDVRKPPKSVSNALYRIKVKLKGLSE